MVVFVFMLLGLAGPAGPASGFLKHLHLYHGLEVGPKFGPVTSSSFEAWALCSMCFEVGR